MLPTVERAEFHQEPLCWLVWVKGAPGYFMVLPWEESCADFWRAQSVQRLSTYRRVRGGEVSYIRWPLYVWESAEQTHIWVPIEEPEGCGNRPSTPQDPRWAARIYMPNDLFDDIVLCHFANMVEEGLVAKAVDRVSHPDSPFRGNVGSFALLRSLGEDPDGEWDRMMAEPKAARDVRNDGTITDG